MSVFSRAVAVRGIEAADVEATIDDDARPPPIIEDDDDNDDVRPNSKAAPEAAAAEDGGRPVVLILSKVAFLSTLPPFILPISSTAASMIMGAG